MQETGIYGHSIGFYCLHSGDFIIVLLGYYCSSTLSCIQPKRATAYRSVNEKAYGVILLIYAPGGTLLVVKIHQSVQSTNRKIQVNLYYFVACVAVLCLSDFSSLGLILSDHLVKRGIVGPHQQLSQHQQRQPTCTVNTHFTL